MTYQLSQKSNRILTFSSVARPYDNAPIAPIIVYFWPSCEECSHESSQQYTQNITLRIRMRLLCSSKPRELISYILTVRTNNASRDTFQVVVTQPPFGIDARLSFPEPRSTARGDTLAQEMVRMLPILFRERRLIT